MGRRGFTAVELLVATAAGLLVLASLSACYAAAARFFTLLAARVQESETLWLALATMTRDLRQAGHDPRGTGLVGIARAGRSHLILLADLDGDGVIDARSRERVAYQLAAGGRLERTIGRQSMPLVEGLRGLAFAYLDAAGQELVPTPELGPAERVRVRLVRVSLITTDPGAAAGTSVALRNLPRGP